MCRNRVQQKGVSLHTMMYQPFRKYIAPLLLALLLGSGALLAQDVRIATWNLCNFGKSKSAQEIAFIAKELRTFDVVAIQEVSTTESGAQAVAALADALDRSGADWDYRISDPTIGEGTERYAFLWKTSKVTAVGDWTLVKALETSIDREPYLAKFKLPSGQIFSCATIHTVPTSKKPEIEIAALVKWMGTCREPGLMVMGDFNCAPDRPCFAPLGKAGFLHTVMDEKTSLKRTPGENGEYLYARYDNIWFRTSFWQKKDGGTQDFVSRAGGLDAARTMSDHLPVWVILSLK